MKEELSSFRVVTDDIREREPIRKGRPPTNDLSKALLAGKTIFIPGPKKGWGNLYSLAKSNGKKARTKSTMLNGERGTVAWFEDIEEGS